jgi:hypothetical protein
MSSGDSSLFYKLIEEVNGALLNNDDGSTQEDQVNSLMKLEVKFKNAVWRYRFQTKEIYKKFVLMVVAKNRNILSARPYFRERSDVFNAHIAPIIRSGDVVLLKKFNINYALIKYIKDNWLGPFPADAQVLYDKVTEKRRIIIENNIPLAINKAKVFWNKVPQAHLALNDLIGIACLGLINGIDKWVGAYDKKIRGMWIGRMTGDLIVDCSETLIHFYPSDKGVLYRAKSLGHRYQIDDPKTLAYILNKSFEEDKAEGRKPYRENSIKSDEVGLILGAGGTVSADMELSTPDQKSKTRMVDMFTKNEEETEEERFIQREALMSVARHIKKLPIIHQKVIKLKCAIK